MTGNELNAFLHEKNITIVGFAAYLNVTPQCVHLWTRNGDKDIPRKYMKAINILRGEKSHD